MIIWLCLSSNGQAKETNEHGWNWKRKETTVPSKIALPFFLPFFQPKKSNFQIKRNESSKLQLVTKLQVRKDPCTTMVVVGLMCRAQFKVSDSFETTDEFPSIFEIGHTKAYVLMDQQFHL